MDIFGNYMTKIAIIQYRQILDLANFLGVRQISVHYFLAKAQRAQRGQNNCIYNGCFLADVASLIEEFPGLTKKDILACIAYANKIIKFKNISFETV